jgi:predicted RNA-binding Zn-ribbon protein involved in translation (DUF1610 family)
MEDIVIVKMGIEPQIYYRHICTQCDAELEIKNSFIGFKCPCCNSEELCVHNAETMVKKYIRTAQTPRSVETKDIVKKTSSKKLAKKMSF